MTDPGAGEPTDATDPDGYTLGWDHGYDAAIGPFWFKPGEVPGYQAWTGWFPCSNLAVSIGTNQAPTDSTDSSDSSDSTGSSTSGIEALDEMAVDAALHSPDFSARLPPPIRRRISGPARFDLVGARSETRPRPQHLELELGHVMTSRCDEVGVLGVLGHEPGHEGALGDDPRPLARTSSRAPCNRILPYPAPRLGSVMTVCGNTRTPSRSSVSGTR